MSFQVFLVAKSKSCMVSFRINAEKASILDSLARATDRSRAWLLEKALDDYLLRNAWQIRSISRGANDLESSNVLDHKIIREWLLNWDKKDQPDPAP